MGAVPRRRQGADVVGDEPVAGSGGPGRPGLSGGPTGRGSGPAQGGEGLVRAYEAASMYYVQGETMEVIARHLGVSRSTVSRLLARARAQGVVRISLVQPGGAGSLEGHLAQVFGVRARVVPVREGTTEIHRLQQVAGVAATHMVDLVTDLAEQAGARPGRDGVGPGAQGTHPDRKSTRLNSSHW